MDNEDEAGQHKWSKYEYGLDYVKNGNQIHFFIAGQHTCILISEYLKN